MLCSDGSAVVQNMEGIFHEVFSSIHEPAIDFLLWQLSGGYLATPQSAAKTDRTGPRTGHILQVSLSPRIKLMWLMFNSTGGMIKYIYL